MKNKFILSAFLFFSSVFWIETELKSQNNALVLNGAYIILDGGTVVTNIYVVVDQTSTLGIVNPGGGHINSEGQYNFVKWNSGTGTGNYIFPFGVGGNPVDYIPFEFNKLTNGNADLSVSTYATNSANIPFPNPVTSMAQAPNSIDRFWDVRSSSNVTADINFRYRGIENTNSSCPTDTLKAQYWNNPAGPWSALINPGNIGVTTGIGSVGVVSNQTYFQNTETIWALTSVPISSSITNSTNVICNGGNTGTATVSATGGQGPYSYSWLPTGGNSNIATGLIAGNYTVTITGAGGCTTTQTIAITQPSAINASATSTQSACSSNTGTATTTASGGTGTLTYNWLPSGGTNATAINLAAGIYTCTITDASGCSQTATTTVTTVNGPSATLQSQQNVLCNGGNSGTATVNPTGGTPGYTYSWSPSGGTSITGTGLSNGNYTCTITDAAGCTVTQSVVITQPTAISLTNGSVPESCGAGNGLAFVSGSGGTPGYTFVWSNSSTNDTISNLIAGSYSVVATDANGCTTSTTVTVTSLGVAVANAGSSVTISAGQNTTLNGSGGVTYSWSPATGLSCTNCQNPTASPTVTTTYVLTVTDVNGCTDVDSVTVFLELPCVLESLSTLLPNAFSPNDDSNNDEYCVPTNACLVTFNLQLYDRWGEKVFESDNFSDCWDGTFKGKALNTDVFAYYFTAVLSDGSAFSQKGNISLLR